MSKDLQANWEMVRLGDLTKIKTGKLDANASSVNGAYPFFTCSKEPLKIDSYSYDCECVLVAGNGDLNVKYYYGKFDAYQRTYIIESINKTILFVPYLYNFLDLYVETLRQQSIGGVIKYIKLGNLTEAKISLPPLEVQKRIADTLDKASKLIELRKQQIEKMDLLVKAKFIDMFGDPVVNDKGWEVKSLDKIGDFKNGINFSSSDNGHVISCLGVGDFKSFNVINGISQLSTVNLSEELSSDYYLSDGDIVFVRSNGNKNLVGRSVLIFTEGNVMTFSGFCIRFRKNIESINTCFLNHLLHTSSARARLLSDGRGCNITNLNQQMLSAQKIIIPPLSLQNEFSTFVEKAEAQKAVVYQGLAKLEQNYKALMQQYFE